MTTFGEYAALLFDMKIIETTMAATSDHDKDSRRNMPPSKRLNTPRHS